MSADNPVHWDRYCYMVVKHAVPIQDCDQAIEFICDFLAPDQHQPETGSNAHPAKHGIIVLNSCHLHMTFRLSHSLTSCPYSRC